MKRQLHIGPEPIDESGLIRRRTLTEGMGAVVDFLGFVRGSEETQKIQGIDYEAFLEMGQHQFELIFQAIEARWPIESVRLVHRLGFVPVGQPSLWVEVVAPHRGEAFAACQYLIDEMKRVVPIWKRPIPPVAPGSSRR
jgi:molybdopterin synthase catalytic subunit